MPRLVRLYVDNVLIGFAIAVAFVALLIALDVGRLGTLILAADHMYLIAAMMVLSFGTLFGGVQFAIAVMRVASSDRRDDEGRDDDRR